MNSDHVNDSDGASRLSPARSKRISELQKQIADLKRRLPKHSVPATMLQQLEELEDELENEIM
jgi:hypothetical protein